MHIFPDEIARFGCQVLWSTKELTCEIECRSVTRVLMDIQVENFITELRLTWLPPPIDQNISTCFLWTVKFIKNLDCN